MAEQGSRGRGYGDRQRGERPDGRRGERPGGSGRSGSSRGERRYGDRDERRGERRDERRGDRRDNRGGHGGRDGRGHAQRGGAGREDRKSFAPQRSGFREERLNKRMVDPDLPDDIDVKDLDPLVLQDLRVLSKDNADAVAKHMIMSATLMEDDPKLALRHARAAKDRAGRVAVAREVNGIAAYRAGEWKEALAELRAARRISGGPGLIAVMADCERGLGRPEKAVELSRSEEAKGLDRETAVELGIVVAGARQDMDQPESAIITLQRLDPSKEDTSLTGLRLAYAYGNALVEGGRTEEGLEWFEHVTEIDMDEVTDAAERVAELTGAGAQDRAAEGEE
ncbi:hypothetical protein H0194_00020 [Corynebacterium incognita]|uniref:TPR-repeat-containing protein n=1 Tax=Corynebacterium incognita TaxID=2754725 RepID=A0A7G7CPJ2_9CORY|nr:hypothetical protein [Corynebacterium incognita]QNE89508.1 hypothetical protein H0194_00020 [Corynebacterium incognita]